MEKEKKMYVLIAEQGIPAPHLSDKQKIIYIVGAIQMSRFLSKNWGSKFLSSDILLS
jgi:hypothetical protein